VAPHPLLARRHRRRRRLGRRRLRRLGAPPGRAVGPARPRVPRARRALPRLPPARLHLLLPRGRQRQSQGTFGLGPFTLYLCWYKMTELKMSRVNPNPKWLLIQDQVEIRLTSFGSEFGV
jgi:hypothetical protein